MKRCTAVLLAFLVLALSMGCSDDETGPTGTGGAGGGTPATCEPSLAEAPVDDSCGVFVSSSLGTNQVADGSKASPFRSINEALVNLGSATAVYLCGEDYNESVYLAAGISVYGGLDCTNASNPWQYDAAKRAVLTGAPKEIALRLSGTGTSVVEDLNVTARNVLAAGASSIAVLVDGAAVDFARCDFNAGDGANGADGAAETPLMQAGAGNAGGDACSMPSTVTGGLAVMNPECSTSIGGNGGDGVEVGNGGDAATGQPGDVDAGLGEGETGAETACTSGSDGDPGTPGEPGAASTDLGSLTPFGYNPPGAIDGLPGLVGYGGGGGGGSKGGAAVCTGMPGAGASGGSGGPGGCGGLGGKGGLGGGSSIALVSVGATVALNECNLSSADGGNGGDGADGQAGQEGGDGGLGGSNDAAPLTIAGCAGGKGGNGGNGGPGAGGIGGHSLGIAYTGMAPTQNGVSIMTGDAGEGGTSSGNAGSSGDKADTQSFDG